MASVVQSQSPMLGQISKPSHDFPFLMSAGLIQSESPSPYTRWQRRPVLAQTTSH